ncbi:hypothetical protein SAY87_024863 [Trapa incisa]|uniref:Uncharacterized protein n=1 Tax=Trapa incisa TaxID=236973 RepID=A0AAN7GA34_9MYRT|nr:hypothetical protein SAY87_024863 [Trapa incisa]
MLLMRLKAAFESAAYAAADARAAVELSRSNGSFGPDSPSSRSPRKIEKRSQQSSFQSGLNVEADKTPLHLNLDQRPTSLSPDDLNK